MWRGSSYTPHPTLRVTLPKSREAPPKGADLGRDGVGQEWNSNMPPRRSTPKMLHRAGELRKQTTPAEKKLWASLRLLREDGVRFRRQHAIGNYITDFCTPRRKLIVELDGSQHLEQEEYDQERTKYLKSQGYKVLRFWNHDVMNHLDGVMCAILDAIGEKNEEDRIFSEEIAVVEGNGK